MRNGHRIPALLACGMLVLGGCYSAGDGDDGEGAAGAANAGASSAGRGGDAARGGSSSSQGGSSSARGGSTSGGSSSGGSSSGGADPECTGIDSNGFFSDCSACGAECDTIDDGSGTRYACGCASGCPCGTSCGCFEIAPNVGVCDICVR